MKNFLFTGASNKPKVIDMQGTTIEQNAFDSTLKLDTYHKSMDYSSFLEFDGIIQAEDFDGDGNEDYLIKSPLANANEAVYYI